MFGQRGARSVSLSGASIAAKPCARFVHDNVARVVLRVPRMLGALEVFAARPGAARANAFGD